jgi:hypothetical protein
MANTFAPFGFAESHRLGAAPDYQIGGARRFINPANGNPIYFGDPVIQLSTGYIAQAAPAGQVSGIFLGCEYVSKAAKKIIWSPYWPGTTSDVVVAAAGGQNTGFDIQAKIVDDPLTVFRVQANGQLAINNMIGMNASFTFGQTATLQTNFPNTNPAGISNVALDVSVTVPGTSVALPFRILDFIREPPGVNGTDFTTPFGWAFVTFNNQDFKQLLGI